MTLTTRAQLATDPTFVSRVQMACTITALGALTSQTPDPASVATSKMFLREPALWAARFAWLAASQPSVTDAVTDEALITLISGSWGFLSGVVVPA